MPKLKSYLDDINQLMVPAEEPGPTEQETRTRELREALGVVAGLVEQLCMAMPEGIDLKGVERALERLCTSLSVKVDAPTVNVEAPSVTVEAPSVRVEPPVVNVSSPEVEVNIPDSKVKFSIYRDDRGLMKTVVAEPVEFYEPETSISID